MLVDRAPSRVAIVWSTAGGHGHRAGRDDTPERIVTITVDRRPISARITCCAFEALGLDRDCQKQMSKMLTGSIRAFTEKDMSLLEVNPLVVTKTASSSA